MCREFAGVNPAMAGSFESLAQKFAVRTVFSLAASIRTTSFQIQESLARNLTPSGGVGVTSLWGPFYARLPFFHLPVMPNRLIARMISPNRD
jgi:hypothetical protein